MQPITRSCGTEGLPADVRLQQRQRTLASALQDLPYLKVPVCYTVLFRTPDENIDVRFIQANHEQLQLDFSAQNADVDSVPDKPPYNVFANMATDTRITFSPTDPLTIEDSSVHVRRVKVSETEFQSVSHCLSKMAAVPGKLNIYIARLADGLLGQAIFKTTGTFTVCAVTYASVGSVKAPGAFGAFGLGRTLTHEVGHTFLLEHPFTGCGERTYPDVPATRFPNEKAQLNPATTDGIGAFGCNHYNDLRGINGAPKSCTGADTSGEFELFFQYMDYPSDANMFMFTRGQAESMYAFLSTVGRQLLSVETLTLTSPAQAAPLSLPPINPSPFPEQVAKGIDWAIFGPILFAVIVFISFGVGLRIQYKRNLAKKRVQDAS